jgi:hypothetical protein
MCEENDKFKNFFDSHFVVTGDENDRVSKKEINDMMNVYNKCNYSERTIVDDIKRLQLNYQRLLRAPYKGASERGVVVGIKKRDYVPDDETTVNFVEEKPMVSDLDFGLDMEPIGQEHPSVTIEERSNAEHLNLLSQASLLNELQKELREEKKQKNEYWNERDVLKEENERLKAELEELKKKLSVPVSTVPEPDFLDELEAAPVKVVESEQEPDFLDELEAAPVKPPKKDKRNETMDKMKQKLSKK